MAAKKRKRSKRSKRYSLVHNGPLAYGSKAKLKLLKKRMEKAGGFPDPDTREWTPLKRKLTIHDVT
jgi:hypothetical protein